ncbi:chemotaxis protein CheW [Biformimicrobium ophioploci]|uniref:Chemotaxis protein CheW n=1 Tax=Biformimicrobium ophioploci TaxID=3036711 RepID=A0ABQ6LUY3_9GAMM|nr:chemotaxis protein CheW [Microbulbifer sp. NKW57]GMG85908.1 chemotaxis protein CheW [Microbulbifer sp. NKW57]
MPQPDKVQTAQTPYQMLAGLASRARAQAAGLPAQQEIKPYWSGVGFSLLGEKFLIALEDVAELLEVPSHTFIPGVKPWVLGVANVRGRLLPLFDLAAFFGGRLQGQRQRRRVLVVEKDKVYAGLVVDEVFGMQHLAVEFGDHAPEGLNAPYASLVHGQFNLQQGRWLVFDMPALLENTDFMDAAAR